MKTVFRTDNKAALLLKLKRSREEMARWVVSEFSDQIMGLSSRMREIIPADKNSLSAFASKAHSPTMLTHFKMVPSIKIQDPQSCEVTL